MYKIVVLVAFFAQTESRISLEFKLQAFYPPLPWFTYLGPVPVGNPWPNPEDYKKNTPHSFFVESKFKEKFPTEIDNFDTLASDCEDQTNDPVSANTEKTKTTVISLEYKPTRPFYHPNPEDTLSQIIFPGKPWPSSGQGYQNFSQSSVNVEERFKETENKSTSSKTETTTSSGFIWEDDLTSKNQSSDISSTTSFLIDRIAEDSISSSTESEITSSSPSSQKQTPISLEYKPIRPFHHSNPGNTLSPMVPPGKPWPDNVQGYQNFSQLSSNLADRIKEDEKTTTPNGFIWEEDSKEKQKKKESTRSEPNGLSSSPPLLINRVQDSASSTERTTSVPSKEQTPISLEYKPNRPFHHPNPGSTLGQIIPPGKPWPSNAEGYQNFSQITSTSILVNRIKDSTTESGSIASSTKVQEKTPISLEYKPTRPSFHPNPGNNIGQIVPPGKPWPSNPEGYQNFSQIASPAPNLEDRIKGSTTNTKRIPSTTVISLEYKPTRPFYHPRPGNTLAQIIPPGKPWPSNLEGYQNFSQTTLRSNVIDRFKVSPQNKPWPNKLDTTNVGFVGETETSSDKEQSGGSVEIDGKSVTEGPLYTSALLELKMTKGKNFDQSTKSEIKEAATTEGGFSTTVGGNEVTKSSEGPGSTGQAYRRAKAAPLEVEPFDWIPSHFFYV